MRLVEKALSCSLAASLAYLSPQQLRATRREWKHTGPFTSTAGAEYAGSLSADYSFVEQVECPTLRASASIFESSSTGDVCVAFRGSTGLRNFRSMFSLGLVPLADDPQSDAKVHDGYQEASLQLYELLKPALERRASSDGRLTFTGHSYGGGTATLCALYAQPDELITFSAPRVWAPTRPRHPQPRHPCHVSPMPRVTHALIRLRWAMKPSQGDTTRQVSAPLPTI